ncbi:hypothetical protein [Bartonella sp. CB189]|uniref:hypothetical protein n=1 Tax=Bartonella sp. CB189 TaxID=3112254 RepID=UPI002F96B796
MYMKYLIAAFAFSSVFEARGSTFIIVQSSVEISSRNSFFDREGSNYLSRATRAKLSYIYSKRRAVVKLVPVPSSIKKKRNQGGFRVRHRRHNLSTRNYMHLE